MNTTTVINHIEDLQVVCFAIVFAIIAAQAPRNKTFRFLLVSYTLGSIVSFADITLMPSPLLAAANLSLISIRYGALAFALAAFARARSWIPRLNLAASITSVIGIVLAWKRFPLNLVLLIDYGTLAAQFSLLCVMLLITREKSTRIPRQLLTLLFAVSVANRCCQVVALFGSPSAIWLRGYLQFVNCTLVGCMVPFTIIWMMNARVHSDLRKQSMVDPLTGLLNRRGLQQAVTRELARYTRKGQNFAVAIADIDHFKLFNDTHGHNCGDLVLTAFAEIAQTCLRQVDVIARTGGEEFTVILAITEPEQMHAVIDRVRLRLAEKTMLTSGGVEVRCTVSIGITSSLSRHEITWEALLSEADHALYEAKRGGRNSTVQFRSTCELPPI